LENFLQVTGKLLINAVCVLVHVLLCNREVIDAIGTLTYLAAIFVYSDNMQVSNACFHNVCNVHSRRMA